MDQKRFEVFIVKYMKSSNMKYILSVIYFKTKHCMSVSCVNNYYSINVDPKLMFSASHKVNAKSLVIIHNHSSEISELLTKINK